MQGKARKIKSKMVQPKKWGLRTFDKYGGDPDFGPYTGNYIKKKHKWNEYRSYNGRLSLTQA
jgi:hypothetical protein